MSSKMEYHRLLKLQNSLITEREILEDKGINGSAPNVAASAPDVNSKTTNAQPPLQQGHQQLQSQRLPERPSSSSPAVDADIPQPSSTVIEGGDPQADEEPDFDDHQLLPPPAREVPPMVYDETSGVLLSELQSIVGVLRHRVTEFKQQKAFTFVDGKGRELASQTYERLSQRVERIYQELHDARTLKKGDRVCLYYRRLELSEFVPAFLAVLAAGLIAVPIVLSGTSVESDISELFYVIDSTRTRLVLTTDYSIKTLQKELANRRQEWPPGCDWWKTNDFVAGTAKRRAGNDTFLHAEFYPNEIAYVDYTKAPTTEQRGVIITHGMIMMNCHILKVCSRMTNKDILLSCLDSRQTLGLAMSVLLALYCGFHSILALSSLVEGAPNFFGVLTQMKATATLLDYTGMSFLEGSLRHEAEVNGSGHAFNETVDAQRLTKLFADAHFLDPQRHDSFLSTLMAHKVKLANDCEIIPFTSVSELGGLVIAMRDQLGYPMDDQDEEDLLQDDSWELLLDREALRRGKVVIVEADTTKVELRGTLRVQCVGYVFPEGQVAIVSMDGNRTLCPPNSIGEIWFSAPFLQGGGLFGASRQTDNLFHSKPLQLVDGELLPLEEDFVKTGLIGCLIDGVKLLVLGTKRERIKQEHPLRGLSNYFACDVARTITRLVASIDECCCFPVVVNNEHLPVVVAESHVAVEEYPRLIQEVVQATGSVHGINLFSVAIVPPNSLQRWKSGVLNLEGVRRSFELGYLNVKHVMVNTHNTVQNIPPEDEKLPDEPPRRAQIVLGPEFSAQTVDERYGTDLTRFKSATEMLIWRADIAPEEIAFTTLDFRGKEAKTVSFKKLSQKVSTFAQYLHKKGLRTGQHVLLLFTLSVDYLIAVHACLYLGLVAIILPPPDMNRLKEDIPVLLNVIDEFNVQCIMVNGIVEELLKSKQVQSTIKLVRARQTQSTSGSTSSLGSLGSGGTSSIQQLTNGQKAGKFPAIINTARTGRTSSKILGQDGLRDKTANDHMMARLAFVNYNADMVKTVVALSQQTVLHQCRVLKEHCGMTSSVPIVSCVRTYNGVGFLHAIFMGIYVGCLTIYIPPFEFSTNPQIWFEVIHKLKVKDTVATYPMLEYAISSMSGSENTDFSLHNLHNLMITLDDRPKPETYTNILSKFACNNLCEASFANTYGPICNPLVSTRSYVNVDLFTIHADRKALRRGRVQLVPAGTAGSLLLQDSGKPPADTMIAIVDPFTRRPLSYHDVGEIWVASSSTVNTFYGKETEVLNAERFDYLESDPKRRFARTGDLGFLHPHPVYDENNQPVDCAPGFCLFVLGSMMDAFQMHGLTFFPIDIETTIERCHPSLIPNGCVVLKLDDRLVVCVEIYSEEDILKCVPVICMSVLDEHQLIVDTVAFVKEGMLAKSRLQEKQRSKIAIAYSLTKLPIIQTFQLGDRGPNQPS